MKITTIFFILFLILISCSKNSSNPSKEKISECLKNEFQAKAKIINIEQQDGLPSEKDGVKYYECYFNSEVEFIGNTTIYKAGEKFKLVKGTLKFIKTENGWNCQQFDFSNSEFIRLNTSNSKFNEFKAIDILNASKIDSISEKLDSKIEEKVNQAINEKQKNNTIDIEKSTRTNYKNGIYIVYGSADNKIYFYKQPDFNTRQKAYISSNEQIYVLKVYNNFGYINFTNQAGKTTSGWIDLSSI